MDEVQDLLKYFLSGIIDFRGQELADKYLGYIAYVGVAISVLIGFFFNDFDMMLLGMGATYVAQLIFCLPIPAYRRNPVEWLSVKAQQSEKTTINNVEIDESL